MCEWTANVPGRLPANQCEVVFYVNPYEWRTGMFSPEGLENPTDEARFDEYNIETGTYALIDNVVGFIVLPPPLEDNALGRIN